MEGGFGEVGGDEDGGGGAVVKISGLTRLVSWRTCEEHTGMLGRGD